MPGLDWLTARPIAHRGLHDAAAGVIENTAVGLCARPSPAATASRCDLQISADGEAMVHHDDALGRLTEGSGRLADDDAPPSSRRCRFKARADRMLTLGELCELVAGRAPLLIELKSRFDGDLRLAQRAAEVLRGYAGPVGGDVVRSGADRGAARRSRRHLPRGIVAERHYAHREWDRLPRRAEAPHGASAARPPHAAAFHRLFGQGPAGAGAADRAQRCSACRC